VHFHPAGGQSPLLAELGVAHGFQGVGAARQAAHHVRQVHGTQLVTVHGAPPPHGAAHLKDADGVLTVETGTAVAVKTADCLPILGVDPQAGVAFAVHAGWRGLTAGMLCAAVNDAVEQGAKLARLYIAIGPAISRERYEVGDDVALALFNRELGLSEEQAALCLAKGRGDRWHADLMLAAVLALVGLGVDPRHVSAMQTCTFNIPQWHSYRREGKGCGSNWSWIRL
jgi:YfiH family protein